MDATASRWKLPLGLILLSGCATNPNKWPMMRAGDPAIERRGYEIHDPLPDRRAGPSTQAEPRGFEIQRTEPRRARERALNVAPPPGALPPYAPESSAYPNTVSPR